MLPGRFAALIGLLLVLMAGCHHQAEAVSASCLAVPTAASDTSASVVQFMKNNSVVDTVCPGMTYKVFLKFPTARTYSVVSTKGAFQGSSGTCVNRAAGTAALQVVDHLKLYLGCAATGSVKVSVISNDPKNAGALLKTVSKPIKALSACPQSPCVRDSTAMTPPASTPATPVPAPTGAAALNLTGNPMVDMMSMMSLLAGASGVGATPVGMVLNYNTVLTVISGLTGLKDRGVEAAGTIKTLQTLLNMVPASSDNTGFLGGMKNFLGVAQGYLPTNAASATAQQQMSGAVLDVVSSMGGMAGVAAAGGTNLAAMVPMLTMMNSVTSLLTLFNTFGTPATPTPPVVNPTPVTTTPNTTDTTTPNTTDTTTPNTTDTTTPTTTDTTTPTAPTTDSGSTTPTAPTTTTEPTTTTGNEAGPSNPSEPAPTPTETTPTSEPTPLTDVPTDNSDY